MSTFHVRVSKTRVAQVDSLQAASAAVRDAIEAVPGWMGGTKWYRTVAGRADGVIVYEATEERGKLVQKPVATISYNGRIWTLTGEEIIAS